MKLCSQILDYKQNKLELTLEKGDKYTSAETMLQREGKIARGHIIWYWNNVEDNIIDKAKLISYWMLEYKRLSSLVVKSPSLEPILPQNPCMQN